MEEEHKFCRRKFQIFGLLQPTKIVPHRITHPEGCNKIVNIFFFRGPELLYSFPGQ